MGQRAGRRPWQRITGTEVLLVFELVAEIRTSCLHGSLTARRGSGTLIRDMRDLMSHNAVTEEAKSQRERKIERERERARAREVTS